jgi:hypothetical protein
MHVIMQWFSSSRRMTSRRMMDGTFKNYPTVFSQIYTMHIKIDGHFLLAAMVIRCRTKRKVLYERVFRGIQSVAATNQLLFRPQPVYTDFETAAVNAVRDMFGISATGCVFSHYSQSVYRKIQDVCLRMAYSTDNPQRTRRWLKRLMALPLVPAGRIQATFRSIQQDFPNVPQVPIIHQYIWRIHTLALTRCSTLQFGMCLTQPIASRPIFARGFTRLSTDQ